MRTPTQLRASTHEERSAAIWRITEALSERGAIVLDHRMFSNAAIAIFFELGDGDTAALRRALEAAGISFDAESEATLARGAEAGDPVSLYVTFVHHDPDLRIDVPEVPG